MLYSEFTELYGCEVPSYVWEELEKVYMNSWPETFTKQEFVNWVKRSNAVEKLIEQDAYETKCMFTRWNEVPA